MLNTPINLSIILMFIIPMMEWTKEQIFQQFHQPFRTADFAME